MTFYTDTLTEIERLETLLQSRENKPGYKANCEAIRQRLSELRATLPQPAAEPANHE